MLTRRPATTLAPALALLLVGATGCRGCDEPGGDARRLVPAGARVAFVSEELEILRARCAAFLAGIEGASGVLELARARYGVDLEAGGGLAEAGIDGAGPLVLFEQGGAVILGLGVWNQERFEALVAGRVEKGAGGTVEPVADDPTGLVATAFGGQGPIPEGETAPGPAWRLAWGMTPARVGLVVGTAGDGDPATLWRTLSAGATVGLSGSELGQAALASLKERAGLWITAEGETS